MDSDSDMFGCSITFDKARSPITMLRYFGLLLQIVVPNALNEALETLYGSKAKLEHIGTNVIPLSSSDPNAPKSHQKVKSAGMEPPNIADRKSSSELLNTTSEAKAVFSETLNSLDLFERYLQWPSEKTAKPLKLLFDRGKSAHNKLVTSDKIERCLDFLRTFLITKCSQGANGENEKSQDSDHQSTKSGNGNLCYDVHLDSQPHSISEEASQKEKSSPVSPNFETSQKNFESKNINEMKKRNKVVNSVTQTSDQNKPGNVTEKFEDNLVQASLEPRAKAKQEDSGKILTTKAKDFVSLDKDSSIDQLDKSNKEPELEIYTGSSFMDDGFPYLNKGKQGKGIELNIKCSATESKVVSEKMLEEKMLKSNMSFQVLKPPALIKPLREKELKQENYSLKKQLELLNVKYEEILAELGQITFEKTAKENEKRKFELFQQIFPSQLSEAKRSVVTTSNRRPINDRLGYPNDYQNSSHVNGCPNRFSKPQTRNKSPNPPPLNASVVYPAASEQLVHGAEVLVQGSNDQPEKEQLLKGDKDENTEVSTFRINNETQRASNITSKEKTSGGEGINQSGKVEGTSDLASTSRQGYEELSFSVQQDNSRTEYISLGNVPPTSVATTLYNNYKLLLLSLPQSLLSCDVVKLKDWASQNFSINDPQNATDILFQLDQKGVINASDLSQLCHFFESITRIDLVYIIDAFVLGDYSLLRQISAPKKQAANAARALQYRTTTMYQSMFNAMNTSRQSLVNPASSGTLQTSAGINRATLRKPENSNGAQRSLLQQTQQAASRNTSDTASPTNFPRSPNENHSTASEQQNLKPATGFTPTRMADVVVADGSSVTKERRTMAGNSSTKTNPSVTNNARNNQTVGSNGSKHSKFQRPETERSNSSNFQSPGGSRNQYLDREDNWLCSHYKRHCYVKFECCNSFWPCHRCHNNQSTCGRKKLKSRDTEMLKCVYCNKVQQFGHSCSNCGAKFAEYYCGLCKHLTGKDDNPYHCEKCGICRIHGDRSFHCDTCGVCLDVQLRGNHKCREGSAHDECCICLEDAFTGCQILPCSHKVHKECATQMIRSGITRCPICRESFAHKLERRLPQPNSRKRSGK